MINRPKKSANIKRIQQADIDHTVEIIKKWIACGCPDKETYVRTCFVEALAPYQAVETKYGELRLQCPSRTAEFRARTFHEKEPETLEWIDSLSPGEVFWDIGANVGLYSLYAAKHGLRILAFEPAPANYHLLNTNIEENRLFESISAYCLAFSHKTELGSFYMASSEPGGALNSFGKPVDWKGEIYRPAMKQGMIAFSIDDFITRFSPPAPQHLKIDVDGLEPAILAGAEDLLASDSLTSVQIELDYGSPEHAEPVIKRMTKAGFKIASKRRAPIFEDTKFANLYNVCFRRGNTS